MSFAVGETVYLCSPINTYEVGQKGVVKTIETVGATESIDKSPTNTTAQVVIQLDNNELKVHSSQIETATSYVERLGYSIGELVFATQPMKVSRVGKPSVSTPIGTTGVVLAPATNSINKNTFLHIHFERFGKKIDRDALQEVENEAGVLVRIGYGSSELIPEIVKEKLQNPSVSLATTQQLQCLLSCIRLGQREAFKATNLDLVVFVGNTGAGKSTLLNYLHQCEFERVKIVENTGAIGTTVTKKVYRVKESSNRKELAKIGHSNQSMTFVPEVFQDDPLVYCDCPGFLDNRGSEINIANAVNIKQTIYEAKSVRVIIMVNYHSLYAERTQGVRELSKALLDLFGGTIDKMKENALSILLCISRAPIRHEEDGEGDEEEGKYFTLDEAKALFSEGCTGMPEQVKEVQLLHRVQSILLALS